MWKGIRRELSAYPKKRGGKKRLDLLDKSEQFNFFAGRYGRRESGQEVLTLRERETSFPDSLRMWSIMCKIPVGT
jgi:hypothetical protein